MEPFIERKTILNLKFGEQAFIGDKPFFYHYGRGSSRDDKDCQNWIEEVTKILKNK